MRRFMKNVSSGNTTLFQRFVYNVLVIKFLGGWLMFANMEKGQ